MRLLVNPSGLPHQVPSGVPAQGVSSWDKDTKMLRVGSLVVALLILFKRQIHGVDISLRPQPMRCQFRPLKTL